MPESSALVVALLAALALGFAVRTIVRRRIAQAEAVVRAEAQAELATARERLAGREEALAGLRAERDSLAAELVALRASESELRARRAELETRLEEERTSAAEKLELLAQAERKLTDAFQSLASRALESNADSFLRQAKQAFDTLQAGAQGDLEQRKAAIEAMMEPLKDLLGRYDGGVRELEKARQEAYGSLTEQLRGLVSTQDGLARETGKLVTALRRPEVRGSWGEMHLRSAVEFAGMVEFVDFEPQVSVDTEDGRLRPDLVIRLPQGKKIVVDAKAPLDGYLAAIEARDDDERSSALDRHARQVRTHLARLAEKGYWKQFEPSPEFVVLFLPGDAYFTAALEKDPALIEDSFRQSVLITTPATLVALLKTVSYGWRQESVAENAREIAAVARELHERVRVFSEHLASIGRGIVQTARAYNAASGSLNRRVLPQGRRLEQLGAGGKPFTEPEPIDTAAADLAAGDEPTEPELPRDIS